MSATCNFRSWLFGEFETVKLDAFSIFCEMEFQTYSTFLSLSTTQNHPGIIKLMSKAIFKATDSIDDIFFRFIIWVKFV